MGVRTLKNRTAILNLGREIQYTFSQTSAEPLASSYGPTFQGLRTEWQSVLLEEIAILDAMSNASAAVDKANNRLDAFAGRVSRCIDDATDGNTRKLLRTALFKNMPLSQFRRPVLGSQLDAMSDWGTTLMKCGVPALAALAAEADQLVAAGVAATTQQNDATKANRDFRDVGARKQFIDKVNAARKEAYGGLSKLPFENPALPQDFADSFFSRDSSRDEEETIDDVKASIEELEAQLTERKSLLKKMQDDEAAAADAEKERQQQEQAADALKAQALDLLKQAAALKSKLKKSHASLH